MTSYYTVTNSRLTWRELLLVLAGKFSRLAQVVGWNQALKKLLTDLEKVSLILVAKYLIKAQSSSKLPLS